MQTILLYQKARMGLFYEARKKVKENTKYCYKRHAMAKAQQVPRKSIEQVQTLPIASVLFYPSREGALPTMAAPDTAPAVPLAEERPQADGCSSVRAFTIQRTCSASRMRDFSNLHFTWNALAASISYLAGDDQLYSLY